MNDSFLRRRDAAQYLLGKYGFGAERTLAKGAVTGDTPEYRKAGRIVLYTREALDRWAISKISAPRASSSDACSRQALGPAK
jgi:hypothetical protein